MGVGKGSIAREIVKQSEYVALDTDDIIESMENRTVKEIFEQEGEDYFRALEKKVSQWLDKSVKNTLISTGGGFYKQKNLKDIGVVVFLSSPFEKILQRINEHPNAEKKLKKRPLLSDLQKAQRLYDDRLPEYLKVADIIIDVADKSAEESAKEILKKVKKYA
ncbi:MAG: shikimate kinase [Campylobacterota bacterium]|nr:shikimate kinase [Campylobacterota bacterium]